MLAVLTTMVGALFLAVRGELFLSQHHRDEVAALYLAQAGIVEAVTELENDDAWVTGFTNKSLAGVPGTYTLTFNTTGAPFTEFESVNNSDGMNPDNYQGANKVPAGCASLVVTAEVGMARRTVEAIVRVNNGEYLARYPIHSGGRVVMRGDVLVNGIKSQSDPTAVPGDIRSTLSTNVNDIIYWDNGGGTGTADITGTVGTTSNAAGAVNLSGYTPDGGVEIGTPQPPVRDVNILAKIAAKTGAATPTINTSGTTLLSGGGDYYYSGDLTINGDLKLQGVQLYVDGALTVNGSITGDGAVYVGGDTKFMGDARVTASSPDKIALFSQGNVELEGFDGTAYMNSITGDSTLTAAWNQLGNSIHDFQTELGSSPSLGVGSTLDMIRSEISNAGSTHGTTNGRTPNAAGTLVSRLNAQPQSSARDAMITKFQELEDLFYAHSNGSSAEIAALNALANNNLITGSFDAAIDNGRYDLVNLMLAYAQAIDYTSLGTSYFQGLVFTHGSLYAHHEVTILGAVVAKDDGTQSSVTIGSDTVDPGDLFLTNGTRVTYVEDFFTDDSGSGGAAGGVLLWMGR